MKSHERKTAFVSVKSAERVQPTERVPRRRRRRTTPAGAAAVAAWRRGDAILLGGGLGYGGWHDYAQRQQVAATALQQRDFVPSVLIGEVRPSGATVDVTLPGTTFAYEAASICARPTATSTSAMSTSATT